MSGTVSHKHIGKVAVAGSVAATLAVCAVVGVSGADIVAAQDRIVEASLSIVDIECASDIEEPVKYYDEPIQRTLSISNMGVDCWVRCKTHLTNNESIIENPLGNSDLSQAWVQADDGWWYSTKPLLVDGSVEFHELVESPAEWGRDYKLSAVTTVQAVQAKHFLPDFDSDQPWGDLEPQASDRIVIEAEDVSEITISPDDESAEV